MKRNCEVKRGDIFPWPTKMNPVTRTPPATPQAAGQQHNHNQVCTTALLTIGKNSETELWELCENFARTLTNFYRRTVHFRHMGVLVSRICTMFYRAECFEDLLFNCEKNIGEYVTILTYSHTNSVLVICRLPKKRFPNTRRHIL